MQKKPCRSFLANTLCVIQIAKGMEKRQASQKMVPKDPSFGSALRELAGLPLGSTVGLRCLQVPVSLSLAINDFGG